MANLLGYTASGLSYILYQVPDPAKYHTFQVDKKGGGQRTINAPIPALKLLQRRLSDLLYICDGDIKRAAPHRAKSRTGYQKKVSIFDNAKIHRSQRYVFNIDIEDFFGSINFGRVRGFFINSREYQLSTKTATILAQIACWNNSLPQGSPCSPVISNLIGTVLDYRISRLSKHSGCYYTRYVDDLTFSTSLPHFPEEIAILDSATGEWSPSDALLTAVERAGFSLNSAKTRMQTRVSRQTVTGLVVNKKVSIRREYRDYARSMLRSLITTGHYHRIPSREHKALALPPEDYATLDTISGIYSHIHYVRNRSDNRDDKLKRFQPSSFRRQYRDLLIFKKFLFQKKPLLICEGKTDSVYLRAALKALSPLYGDLYDAALSPNKFKVDFFKYSKAATEILELGGGSGDMQKFIRHYGSHWKKLKHLPVTNPIIFIVDNDDGGKQVFKAVNEVIGPSITTSSSDSYYHIFHNAYLVKTPKIGSTTESCIEDLFDKATLATKVSGKSFNKEKTQSTDTEYGKQIFADQVVRPNWNTINFDGFKPLLNSIQDVIQHFTPIP